MIDILKRYTMSLLWIILYGLNLKKYKKRCIFTAIDLYADGSTIVLLNVTKYFVKHGYEVLLIARKTGPLYANFRQQGVKILFCRKRNAIAKKIIQNIKTDIIFINTLPMFFWLEGWKSDKVRKIWWLHEGVSFMKTKAEQLRKIHVSDVEIYCVSSRVKAALKAVDLNWKTQYLYYCVPDTAESTLVYKKENTDERINVLCIGSIYPLKNQMEFLQACKQLDTLLRTRCRFIVIGKSTQQDYYYMVRKTILENDWIEYIEYVKHEEMEKFYKHKCIIVSTSTDDSLPVVLAEGMMYGNIIITSSETGFYNMIVHGEDGFGYQLGDIDSLTRLLDYSIRHYDDLEEMRKNARELYLENFSQIGFENRLEEIVEKNELRY